VGAVLMGSSDKVKEVTLFAVPEKIASINVGEGVMAALSNPLGEPIDGKGPIQGKLS